MKYFHAAWVLAALLFASGCPSEKASEPKQSCYKTLPSGGTQYDKNLCEPKKTR